MPRKPTGWLWLAGITRNNLLGLDAAFPLGCLTAATGVSGSGKSSLISQALPELVASHPGRAFEDPDNDEQDPLFAVTAVSTGSRITEGMDTVRRLVCVDQKPIGRTPCSNLATYTGLFDHVRKLLADTPLAHKRRYSAGHFSFNVTQGRCPTCEDEGFVSVELLFLPSVYAPCPTRHGTRYNAQTLEVTWRDKNIAEMFRLTVDAVCDFFANEVSVTRALNVLRDIGLGYLRLGQPATELSDGEAQRIKLATELQRAQRSDTLCILGEPTTGLYPADVDRLMVQLQGLVDAGNTVVVIEHDMWVAAQSDWIIDAGPGAGDAGGKTVASGTPVEIVHVKESRTVEYLRWYLNSH